jgi:GNAT superfamily N-acetyltransferase
MRQMAPGDIEAGLRFCRASGWNQTSADWDCFLQANGAGCRVALVGGEVAGTVATLRFEDRFGWISMLLVAPELRGRGIGTALLMESLRVLSDVACVRLDATPAGKQVYDKCGFEDEYPLARMCAERVSAGPTEGARRMTERDFEGVLRLDREVFGADRGVVLSHLRESAPEYAWVTEWSGQIAGFALGRHGVRAEHVGPVVARDAEMAWVLASACVSANSEKPWLLDAPQHSDTWTSRLVAAGFRKERPFMRMFRGKRPEWGRPEAQFAIAGPEFG